MSKKKLILPPKNGPKILLLDIETAPILGYVWGLWENNLSLNQIKSDWHLLSWSAKWLGDAPSKTMYQDQRHAKDVENDKELLKDLWTLLDQADITVTQNGISFDHKKINARFILNGYKPPSSFKQVDTLRIAKKKFGFTSNKLEYMTSKLCTKYKKLTHKKFPGMELWLECLKNNIYAWKEMELYNKHDVLSLEELYLKLQPYDNSFNPNVYSTTLDTVCACGSKQLHRNGFSYTSMGKFQRFSCGSCGAEVRSRENLFTKEKKKSLKARS